MRIKKVSQTTATQAQVVNNENNSQLNAYSCNYVNGITKDVYSTDEVKTNKVWIDGRPIYRKVLVAPVTTYGESFFIDTGIPVASTGIICFDKSKSFLVRPLGTIQCGVGINTDYDFDSRYFSRANGVTNWKAGFLIGESIYQGSTVYATIEYTKLSD